MSYARKHAITAAIIWTLILGGLIAVVLGPGASRFTAPDQSIWRFLAAAIILPGFLLNAWLGWKSKRGKKLRELDERDEASGTVPTGWLYLLAYGTMALVSLVHAVATLVIDWSGAADG